MVGGNRTLGSRLTAKASAAREKKGKKTSKTNSVPRKKKQTDKSSPVAVAGKDQAAPTEMPRPKTGKRAGAGPKETGKSRGGRKSGPDKPVKKRPRDEDVNRDSAKLSKKEVKTGKKGRPKKRPLTPQQSLLDVETEAAENRSIEPGAPLKRAMSGPKKVKMSATTTAKVKKGIKSKVMRDKLAAKTKTKRIGGSPKAVTAAGGKKGAGASNKAEKEKVKAGPVKRGKLGANAAEGDKKLIKKRRRKISKAIMARRKLERMRKLGFLTPPPRRSAALNASAITNCMFDRGIYNRIKTEPPDSDEEATPTDFPPVHDASFPASSPPPAAATEGAGGQRAGGKRGRKPKKKAVQVKEEVMTESEQSDIDLDMSPADKQVEDEDSNSDKEVIFVKRKPGRPRKIPIPDLSPANGGPPALVGAGRGRRTKQRYNSDLDMSSPEANAGTGAVAKRKGSVRTESGNRSRSRSSTAGQPEAKVQKKAPGRKKKELDVATLTANKKDDEAPAIKKTGRRPFRKRMKTRSKMRDKFKTDIKDLIVGRRMASINATAMLNATYKKEKYERRNPLKLAIELSLKEADLQKRLQQESEDNAEDVASVKEEVVGDDISGNEDPNQIVDAKFAVHQESDDDFSPVRAVAAKAGHLPPANKSINEDDCETDTDIRLKLIQSASARIKTSSKSRRHGLPLQDKKKEKKKQRHQNKAAAEEPAVVIVLDPPTPAADDTPAMPAPSVGTASSSSRPINNEDPMTSLRDLVGVGSISGGSRLPQTDLTASSALLSLPKGDEKQTRPMNRTEILKKTAEKLSKAAIGVASSAPPPFLRQQSSFTSFASDSLVRASSAAASSSVWTSSSLRTPTFTPLHNLSHASSAAGGGHLPIRPAPTMPTASVSTFPGSVSGGQASFWSSGAAAAPLQPAVHSRPPLVDPKMSSSNQSRMSSLMSTTTTTSSSMAAPSAGICGTYFDGTTIRPVPLMAQPSAAAPPPTATVPPTLVPPNSKSLTSTSGSGSAKTADPTVTAAAGMPAGPAPPLPATSLAQPVVPPSLAGSTMRPLDPQQLPPLGGGYILAAGSVYTSMTTFGGLPGANPAGGSLPPLAALPAPNPATSSAAAGGFGGATYITPQFFTAGGQQFGQQATFFAPFPPGPAGFPPSFQPPLAPTSFKASTAGAVTSTTATSSAATAPYPLAASPFPVGPGYYIAATPTPASPVPPPLPPANSSGKSGDNKAVGGTGYAAGMPGAGFAYPGPGRMLGPIIAITPSGMPVASLSSGPLPGTSGSSDGLSDMTNNVPTSQQVLLPSTQSTGNVMKAVVRPTTTSGSTLNPSAGIGSTTTTMSTTTKSTMSTKASNVTGSHAAASSMADASTANSAPASSSLAGMDYFNSFSGKPQGKAAPMMATPLAGSGQLATLGSPIKVPAPPTYHSQLYSMGGQGISSDSGSSSSQGGSGKPAGQLTGVSGSESSGYRHILPKDPARPLQVVGPIGSVPPGLVAAVLPTQQHSAPPASTTANTTASSPVAAGSNSSGQGAAGAASGKSVVASLREVRKHKQTSSASDSTTGNKSQSSSSLASSTSTASKSDSSANKSEVPGDQQNKLLNNSTTISIVPSSSSTGSSSLSVSNPNQPPAAAVGPPPQQHSVTVSAAANSSNPGGLAAQQPVIINTLLMPSMESLNPYLAMAGKSPFPFLPTAGGTAGLVPMDKEAGSGIFGPAKTPATLSNYLPTGGSLSASQASMMAIDEAKQRLLNMNSVTIIPKMVDKSANNDAKLGDGKKSGSKDQQPQLSSANSSGLDAGNVNDITITVRNKSLTDGAGGYGMPIRIPQPPASVNNSNPGSLSQFAKSQQVLGNLVAPGLGLSPTNAGLAGIAMGGIGGPLGMPPGPMGPAPLLGIGPRGGLTFMPALGFSPGTPMPGIPAMPPPQSLPSSMGNSGAQLLGQPVPIVNSGPQLLGQPGSAVTNLATGGLPASTQITPSTSLGHPGLPTGLTRIANTSLIMPSVTKSPAKLVSGAATLAGNAGKPAASSRVKPIDDLPPPVLSPQVVLSRGGRAAPGSSSSSPLNKISHSQAKSAATALVKASSSLPVGLQRSSPLSSKKSSASCADEGGRSRLQLKPATSPKLIVEKYPMVQSAKISLEKIKFGAIPKLTKSASGSSLVEEKPAVPAVKPKKERKSGHQPRQPLIPWAKRSKEPPKNSGGWSWKGNPSIAKIHLNNEEHPVERVVYPAMWHEEGDEEVKVKDCILLASGNRKKDLPFIAKVTALWENPEDGEMMMSVLWYYRPEHTDIGRQPGDLEPEVFASRHRDHTSVACIEDKCFVMTFNEYCRYQKFCRMMEENVTPAWSIVPEREGGYPRARLLPTCQVASDRVFICRKVYDSRCKRMLKNPY